MSLIFTAIGIIVAVVVVLNFLFSMPCDSPLHVTPKGAVSAVPVPCGRCPPCKLRRVNGWVFRLLEQEKVSTSSHFVTLTYDTHAVPISQNGYMTLCKKDLQDYWKRLRKLCPDVNVKYYAVGEYGSKTQRPHYHAIVFNVPDTAMFFDAWHLDGKSIGSVHVGSVSSDSIAYTLKYIDKPHWVRRHSRDDRQLEFSLMSKNLGVSYLSPAVVKYHHQHIGDNSLVKKSGHRIAMPRYYREKIFSEQQRKYQRTLIESAVLEQETKLRIHVETVLQMDFDRWKESGKVARFRRFYSSSQKQREL